MKKTTSNVPFSSLAKRLAFLPVPPSMADYISRGNLPSFLQQANLQEALSVQDMAKLKLFFAPFTALLGLCIGLLLGGVVDGIVIAAGVAILGFLLPDSSIKQAANTRQTTISRSLPLAMEVIGLTVEKTSIESGIDYYCQYFSYEPLAEELKVSMQRVKKFKESLDVALAEMLLKNQNDDLSFFVAAVGQAAHLGGGDLKSLLVDQATQLRTKQSLAGKTKSSKAPAMLTLPTMLNVLAVMVVIGGMVALKMGSSYS